MPEAVSRPKALRRTVRALTVEEARGKILGKLEKAGVKGSASLYPPKTTDPDRATYAAALASLVAAEEVFADRRKTPAKFFVWPSRPIFPTAEAIAGELVELAQGRFPLLSSDADFKKALGKDKDRLALLPAALALLVEDQRVVALKFRAGKKDVVCYASTAPLRELLGTASPAEVPFPAAYSAVVSRTGFPAVMLSELQRESGAELPALHQWLIAEHRAGRAVLSLGDWSLATFAQREAALEMHGDRYLQARLLP